MWIDRAAKPRSIGIWTFAFDGRPVDEVRKAAAEVEALGYEAIWFGEALGREATTQAAILLEATSRIGVATGVTGIYGRDAFTMAQAEATLHEAYPQRFVLGLGVSNADFVKAFRGHDSGPPVKTMKAYLEAMDATLFAPQGERRPRVLAAVGPKMIEAAATLTTGALTYWVPTAHTERARRIMGPDAFLAVEQAVVLDDDRDRAKAIATDHVEGYKVLKQYTRMLKELGIGDAADPADSERIVDAIVAYGTLDDVATRVREQFEAGADHVCIQVLRADTEIPVQEWRDLASALLA